MVHNKGLLLRWSIVICGVVYPSTFWETNQLSINIEGEMSLSFARTGTRTKNGAHTLFLFFLSTTPFIFPVSSLCYGAGKVTEWPLREHPRIYFSLLYHRVFFFE